MSWGHAGVTPRQSLCVFPVTISAGLAVSNFVYDSTRGAENFAAPVAVRISEDPAPDRAVAKLARIGCHEHVQRGCPMTTRARPLSVRQGMCQ
jgi:hypothetical protein